jgi:hypothetical protein
MIKIMFVRKIGLWDIGIILKISITGLKSA